MTDLQTGATWILDAWRARPGLPAVEADIPRAEAPGSLFRQTEKRQRIETATEHASHGAETMAHARVEDALALFLAALPRRLRFADVAGMLKLTPAELQAAFDAQGANPRDRLRHVRLQRLHDDLRRKRYDEVGLAHGSLGISPPR